MREKEDDDHELKYDIECFRFAVEVELPEEEVVDFE